MGSMQVSLSQRALAVKLGLNKGTCSLQQESDYAGSTSEEGLRGLYHGDSRILIEIQMLYSHPKREPGAFELPRGELLSL